MPGERADRAMRVGLFVVAVGVLLIQQRDGIVGGLHLVGAERVLRGEIPYRDFWTIYAPGHYYVLAGLLALFGRHWAVSGLAGATCFAVAVPLFHGFLRDLGASRLGALLGAGILLAVAFSTPFSRSFGTYPPTLVLLLLAWRSLVPALDAGAPPRRLFVTGLWLGAAALFKHDVAAWAALAMVGGVALDAALRRQPDRGVRRSGWLVLGAILVFAPPMGVLAARAGADMLQDLLVFPATDFRFARPELYPSLIPHAFLHFSGGLRGRLFAACDWAIFALPLAVALCGALVALGRPRRAPSGPGGADARPLFFALALAFGLHFTAAHVQINTNIVSMTVYAVALAAQIDALAERRRVGRALVVAGGLGWMAALVAQPVLTPLLRTSDDRVALDIPGARHVRVYRVDAQRLHRLRALVEAYVPPGEPIFVGERRHDILIANAVELYYLLDRPPATRYHELHPAVADTGPVQREIVDRFTRDPPRLVVLRDVFDEAFLDTFKARLTQHVPEVGSRLLDAYLHRHYREIAVLGPYHVLVPVDPANVASPDDGAGALPDAGPLR